MTSSFSGGGELPSGADRKSRREEPLTFSLLNPLSQVSDGALRCFASLADRFTRRGVDPAPLAKHGLTEELLSRMAAAGGVATGPASSCKPGRTSTGGAPSGPDSKLSNQVSTIVSLLSTLCRGSPLVTHVREPQGVWGGEVQVLNMTPIGGGPGL